METGDVLDPTDRLRDVFDLCDVDRKGFITVDHFIELAKAHFTTDDDASQQDWDDVVSVLKADGNDHIDFSDFCLRIKQILELQEKGSINHADENKFSAQNDLVGGATPYEENGSTHYNADSDVSPLSSIFTRLRLSRTFSDECISSLTEDATNSSTDIGADIRRVVNGNQQVRTSSSLEEDFFEDTGQADTMEHHLLAPPFHKPLTPASPRSFSSQLYRGSPSVNMSSRSSFSEEMFQNVDDQSLQDLNDKVGRLQNQIDDLMDSQRDNEQRQLRMKEENFLLSEKLLVLEEQVRDTEHRTRDQLIEQQRRHSELVERISKENSTEIEILTLNLQSIQSECQHLKYEVPVLMNENEKLSKENVQLEKERDSLRKQFAKLTEDHESLREHMHSEHNKMTQEQKVHRQLIHELTAELEELRQSKNEVLRAIPSSRADLPRSLRSELEDHILQLKQENAVIRGQRDDLHAQLLHQHVQEGRSLLTHKATPWNTEMEKLPKAELIKVLQKEVEANGKLREYVELITLRILEKNPSILEVSSMATT